MRQWERDEGVPDGTRVSEGSPKFSTGPDPSGERGRPQEEPSFPQAGHFHGARSEESVSRETAQSPAPDPVPRARDLSEVRPSLADPYGSEPTPLAQAAEHMLLALLETEEEDGILTSLGLEKSTVERHIFDAFKNIM